MDVGKSEQHGWKEGEYRGLLIRTHPDMKPMVSDDKGKTWRDLEPAPDGLWDDVQTHIIEIK